MAKPIDDMQDYYLEQSVIWRRQKWTFEEWKDYYFETKGKELLEDCLNAEIIKEEIIDDYRHWWSRPDILGARIALRLGDVVDPEVQKMMDEFNQEHTS